MSEACAVAKITLIGTLGAAVIAGLVTQAGDDPEAEPERVAGVTLSSQIGTFAVRCPVTIVFEGTIDVEQGTGEVVYRWLRSDGFNQPTTAGERQRIAVDGPGSVTVTDEWIANVPVGDVARTTTLEVLQPGNVKSDPVVVTGLCDADLPPGPPAPPLQVPGDPPG